jgi:hypothetical protein
VTVVRGGTRRRGHGPETGRMGREHLHRVAPRPPGDSTPVSHNRRATVWSSEGIVGGGTSRDGRTPRAKSANSFCTYTFRPAFLGGWLRIRRPEVAQYARSWVAQYR